MKREILLGTLLVLAVLAVYAQTAGFDFVNFDDPDYVYENARVLSGLSGDNVVWALSTGSKANWHPATWISLMIDAQLFGPGARGFHLTNVLLHLLNTLLLFAILRLMTGAVGRSAVVAALFAVHPMHVESVAWITERKDTLSLFWGLLSLLFYARYARGGGVRPYVLSMLCLAIGLMAKSLLVTLPAVFVLLDYWPLRRSRALIDPKASRLWLEKLPYLALVVASSAATWMAQAQSGAVTGAVVLGPGVRAANALAAYGRYLLKAVWPHDMAYLYPHPAMPGGTPLTAIEVGGGALALLAISLLAWRFRERRHLTVGWLWFLGTMVPMIGLIQVGTQSMADRYAYLPYIGLYIAVVWSVGEMVKPGRGVRVAVALAVVVTAALGLTAFRQAGVWRDSVTLGSHAVALGAAGPKVSFNLGTALSRSGRFAEAIPHYERAVRLKPDHKHAFNNLGRTLDGLGRRGQALDAFDRALAIDRDFALAWVNRSNTLDAMQRWHEAAAARARAVALQPDNVEWRANLGRMLAQAGDLEGAIRELESVLGRAPGHRDAARNLELARRLLAEARAVDAPQN